MALSSPRATATLPGVSASVLYFSLNCELSARSTPEKSQSIRSRSRACFAVQNLSAMTATPRPLPPTGISKTSTTPGTLRAALSSNDFGDAPNTGGRATTAIFIPGRSRSSPNFIEPSHFGELSRRRVPFPINRNSAAVLSVTVSGTGRWDAASANSAYFADCPPGPWTTLDSVRHCSGATFHFCAAAATSMARVRAPNSRYC